MTITRPLVATLLLTATLLSGCHVTSYSEEVHLHSSDSSEAAISYDLASVHGMAPDEWFHFPLYGHDSAGDNWNGYVTKQGLAGRWLDGIWVIPTTTELRLVHEPSGGTIHHTTTLYLDQYDKEVKLELGNGVVCYPDLTNDIPRFAQDGDYGELASMNCSDGSELYGIWDLYGNPDLSADYVTHSTFWYGDTPDHSLEVTQTLDPDGRITAYATTLYDEVYGVTIWLYSD